MYLSMRWLSDYVKLNDISAKQFADAMTMSGSKVEGWEVEGEALSGIIVGRVISIEKHPDADSLFVCKLDMGDKELQIITAATNVVAGALVPVATHGAVLAGGKVIKSGKLRGLPSEGMLCSLEELGLTVNDFPYADEDGIFLLREDCAPGDDIRQAIGLNDTVVEFEITSNRPDCLSMLGLAREASATFGVPLSLPEPSVKQTQGDISELLSVEVKNPELCPRYLAMMVKDVKIGPSPRWLRERLRACGVRPINNIVDITNYVMLEYGQPMHAFDYKYVNGGKIIVRNALPGEKITTLDGTVRRLSPEMLVIADEKEASAVAGVMGGEFSSISEDTSVVVFESANFDRTSVRRTSRALGLRTESSSRFEKGIDPATCAPAALRACQLVELLGAGTVVGGVIDADNSKKEPARIKLDRDWINALLGIGLSEKEMVDILTPLGFVCDNGVVTVPSWRADATHKADLAEEVARLYGYDKIPVSVIRGIAAAALTDDQVFSNKAIDLLLSQGFYEIITYSFISPKYYDKINLPGDSPLRDCVRIMNPLGEDTSVMRTTTLPSMMEALSRNYNNRAPAASLFELATLYIPSPEGGQPQERRQITLGAYGPDCDFFTLKGVIEQLLSRLRVKDWDIDAESADPAFHPGRCAALTVGGVRAGVFGEAHPVVLENYGVQSRMYLAQLDMQTLFESRGCVVSYRPTPKYPSTTRDIAVVCDESLSAKSIALAITAAAGKLLESVKLFDLYRGAQIPEGKKSLAYSIVLRAADRTLTDEDADRVMKKIIAALGGLGAGIRE